MEPEGTLKNNSGLTEMRAWQKQYKQWTSYLKSQGFPLNDKLYAEMLLGRCDPTIKHPLKAMDDLYQLGEEKLWEKIENIYVESNPLFLRRARCYESKPMKGELVSEFAARLKLQYKEAEMAKTTVWGHLEYKILTDLDISGSDNRELKAKLVEELRKRPNPDEKQLEQFLQIIKDHEAMLRARDHHQTEEGRNVNRVGTGIIENNPQAGVGDGTATGPVIPRPHQLCGKVHPFGRCNYKCKTCGKTHREEHCWIAHPEKAPKNFKSPRKDHQRGRGNSRDSQTGRNRSNSRDRGGDNRPKSPRDVTGRVTTEVPESDLET